MRVAQKNQHHAQVQALRWLQGRISDQFVKAYISNEIALLERIGYPINSSGTELVITDRVRRPRKNKTEIPVLPGQTNIMEALNEGARTRHGECRIHGRISTDNGTLEVETASDGTTTGQRCGLCAAATDKLSRDNGASTS